MKAKDKKKEVKQSKKRQLLSVFRQSVAFLQILTPEELDLLEDRLHIFVFSRGQCLAKEGEIVDYVGVIAQGRAVGKGKAFEVGDVIGHAAVLGYQSTHPRTIIVESDGIVVALRIIDLLSIDKPSLKNRMLSYFVEIYGSQVAQREGLGKVFQQFQTVEEKKISKYLSQEWSTFFTSDMDSKEKAKFITYFPFYRIKQKDLLSNQTLKPSIIYVIQGQLIAKNRQDQRVIESGSIFNIEGFIFNQNSTDNVYCLSTQASVLVVDRSILESSFKFETYKTVMKILLGQLSGLYKRQPQDEEQEGREVKSWSMFKKYPNAEILPLPKKAENVKPPPKASSHNQNASLIAFQTLFREQLGSGKQKTTSSLAESGYDKLYTLKTESAGKEVQAALELDKLRKEVELLTEKVRFAEESSKLSKLELIENRSRVNMGPVFKQICKLRQEDDIIRHGQTQQELQPGENFLTLKEALDKQLKNNKIQMLVAKCAFKWLYITRKRKAGKKD